MERWTCAESCLAQGFREAPVMIPVSSGKEQGKAELPSPVLGQAERVYSLWGSGCLASYLFALVPASGLSELVCHHQRFMWTSYVWRRLLLLAGDSQLWGILLSTGPFPKAKNCWMHLGCGCSQCHVDTDYFSLLTQGSPTGHNNSYPM